ncbi:MAG: hypothetical protein H8E39_03015 [Alphaproteobacteria bacterium]|nr:hypothetical protein [Alphaproteobacteria bacterium]
MRTLSLAAFAALYAFALAGPATADPKWGWGDCDHKSTLSVENEQGTDQSVAENPAPEPAKPQTEN